MEQLDRTDLEILDHLSNNARLSNKNLADKLGVAPSTSLERVRVLRLKKIIKGFYTEIDVAPLGITLHAMVAIQLAVHSQKLVDSFYKYAVQLTEVSSVYHLGGATDFLIQVAVTDTAELRAFVLSAFAERSEVNHIETSLIYEQSRKHSLPFDVEQFPASNSHL